MSVRKFFRHFFVFILIASWVYSGWPHVYDFFQAPLAKALNKINNWNFNGSANYWSTTNGTAAGNTSGGFQCFNTSQATTNNMATFAYNANLGGRAAFQGTSGAVKNTDYRGYIFQTTTVPGSGSVKGALSWRYYGNSTNWGSGMITLDFWDSANTTYVGGVDCQTLSSNTSWTLDPTTTIAIAGGATYTLRISLTTKTKSNANVSVTLGVDDIIINFAPTGLATSTVASTTGVRLDWATSTAGIGAGTLHATAPYRIARGDNSNGLFPPLFSTTTNFYTDTSTVGNTTYYYYVTDVDTDNFQSASSSLVVILTLPGVPTTPTFSDVQANSLTVSWTAPTGGSPNYRVERAPDSGGSPGSWAEIGTTSSPPYLDSGLSGATTYWYRVRGFNDNGNGAYSAANSTTTAAAATVSCSTVGSPSAFGTLTSASVAASSPNSTTTMSCTFSGGCTLSVKDGGNGTNPGLTTTPAYIIGSADSSFGDTATLTVGTEGYGIQAATTSAGSGGVVLIYTRYKQTGNAVGGLELTNQGLASSSVAVTDREIVVTHKAAISDLTQPGSYQDVLTYSCVGN